MGDITRIVALVCALALGRGEAPSAVAPVAAGEPAVELEPAPASSTLRRVEHFVLLPSHDSPARDALGLVEWRERDAEGGLVLERDVLFAGGELTLRHVERLTAETRRLVWREAGRGVGATGGRIGRSQIVEPEGDRLQIVDWLRSGVERVSLVGARDASFPLALVEELRAGGDVPERVTRYWPPTRSLETLTVLTDPVAGGAGPQRRLFELRRDDGSLAGRFLFDGDALEGFQWQDGGAWARRVTPARHRELRAGLLAERTVEAAATSR